MIKLTSIAKFAALSLVLSSSLLAATVPSSASKTPQRLITIGGAITEIVYALGAEHMIAACDTTSYYPKAAEELPKVGYMRALSAEGILSLAPTKVLITPDAGPASVIKQIELAGAETALLKSARSVDDIIDNITQISTIVNREDEGEELITMIRAEQQQLAEKVSSQSRTPDVLFILQHAGPVPNVAGAGTAADAIIKLAGGRNVAEDFHSYKPLTAESAVALDPEIIILTDQGVKQAGSVDKILSMPGLSLTRAAKNKHVIVMDSLLLLGFGPRTTQAALDIQAQISQ